MLFNSWTFVGFLAIVLPLYYLLRFRRQNILLLVASCVFYGFWDWRFLGLLWLSTIIDYIVARKIQGSEDDRLRKRLLWLSIGMNLGILGFFKYFNFFADSTTHLLNVIGMNATYTTLNIVLPVGISFYTFQTLAYTVDVYRGRQRAVDNFVDYAVYVSYFPQLVAGPIERAQRLLPQIQSPRKVTPRAFHSGIQLILWGYLKKVVVADGLAPIVNEVFADPGSMDSMMLLIGAYCFTLQIYGDFSGYSDIARGVSRLLGIELMENFKQPYLSRNITEFWRRWHISLSTWLRDYLYIPLGGNRNGVVSQYRNLLITMLLGGLWHGASWNFILWGGLHGVYLSIHKFATGDRKIAASVPEMKPLPLASHFFWVFLTFNLVCLTFVPFRLQDFSMTVDFFAGILHWTSSPGAALNYLGFYDTLLFGGSIVLILDVLCWKRNSELPFTEETPWWIRSIAYASALVALAYIGTGSHESFIYFQF